MSPVGWRDKTEYLHLTVWSHNFEEVDNMFKQLLNLKLRVRNTQEKLNGRSEHVNAYSFQKKLMRVFIFHFPEQLNDQT